VRVTRHRSSARGTGSLRRSTRRHSVLIAGVRATAGTAYRYNLTVRELHTYYVVTGGVPILVHNVCGSTARSHGVM
jgi:hypothetical protein